MEDDDDAGQNVHGQMDEPESEEYNDAPWTPMATNDAYTKVSSDETPKSR